MHFEKLGKSLAYHLLPGKGSLLQTKSNTVLEHITTIHYWQWYRVEVETKGWKSEIQSIIKAVLIFDVLQFYINIWKISKKQNQLVNTRPGVGQCLGLPWQSSTALLNCSWFPSPPAQTSDSITLTPAMWEPEELSDSCSDPSFARDEYWGGGDKKKLGKRGLQVLKNELKNCLKVIRCFVQSPALAGFQAAFWNKTKHDDNIAWTLNKEIN